MIKKILNSAMLMTWTRDFVRIGSPLFVIPLVLIFYSAEVGLENYLDINRKNLYLFLLDHIFIIGSTW